MIGRVIFLLEFYGFEWNEWKLVTIAIDLFKRKSIFIFMATTLTKHKHRLRKHIRALQLI